MNDLITIAEMIQLAPHAFCASQAFLLVESSLETSIKAALQ